MREEDMSDFYWHGDYFIIKGSIPICDCGDDDGTKYNCVFENNQMRKECPHCGKIIPSERSRSREDL